MDGYRVLAFVSAMSMLLAGCVFLLMLCFHVLKMLMNRTGDWRGYALPFGFLIDATLTEDGRKHRKKAGVYLAIGAPFWFGCLLVANLMKNH